jgi:protein phosphatase
MLIQLAEPCLVLLMGPSGAGKSTFAKRHFNATEILSSDFCRALVSDDENDQTATGDAFELLHLILSMRLKRKRTTVVDATNVQPVSRATLMALAKQSGLPSVAIVFLLPEEVCQARNRQRLQRRVPAEIIQRQFATLAAGSGSLGAEGFDAIYTLTSEADAQTLTLQRSSN